MAYTITANQTPASAAIAVYLLKTALKAAGWTVVRSGDATSYFNASDGITSGASGAGGLNNTGAWFVIQMPGSTRQLCIQRNSTAQAYRIKYSPVNGFTGGAPSATVVPSATDEKVICGTGTDGSPTGQTVFAADGTYRTQICVGGAAEGYNFYMASYLFTTGAGSVGGTIFLDKLLAGSYPPSDTDPYVIGVHTNSVTALLSSAFSDASGTNFTRTQLAAASHGLVSGISVGIGTSGLNPWTGQDDLLPLFWVRTIATTGYKGISSLFRFGSAPRANTSMSADKTRWFMGNVWLPWDGVTPVLL